MAERMEPADDERGREEVNATEHDDRWHRPGMPGAEDTARILGYRGVDRSYRGDDREDDGDLVDLGEDDEEPLDLSAVQSDDALLDALGGTNPEVPARDDHRVPDLETLLVAWRRDVDAAPIGELVDVDAAVAAIADGSRRSTIHRRYLIPVATAAAVLMIAFTGVGLAARNALPGDMLWGVAQVLYTDHAREVQAATSARTELANANAAFLLGDRMAAEAALKRAQDQMHQVDAQHGLAELKAAQASLAAKVGNADSTSTSSSSSRPHGTSPPAPSMFPPSEEESPILSTSPGPPSESSSSSPSSPPPTSSSDNSSPPSTTGGRSVIGGSTN